MSGTPGGVMIFAKPATAILTALAVAAPTSGADIVGAWTIHGSVFFNAVDTVCLFKGETALSRHLRKRRNAGAYTPATLIDRKVAWSWDADRRFWPFRAHSFPTR